VSFRSPLFGAYHVTLGVVFSHNLSVGRSENEYLCVVLLLVIDELSGQTHNIVPRMSFEGTHEGVNMHVVPRSVFLFDKCLKPVGHTFSSAGPRVRDLDNGYTLVQGLRWMWVACALRCPDGYEGSQAANACGPFPKKLICFHQGSHNGTAILVGCNIRQGSRWILET